MNLCVKSSPNLAKMGEIDQNGQTLAVANYNGGSVAAFPVAAEDQIMLVTNGGQLIRCPVNDIRIAGRNTQGVTLFKVAKGERVVSVARLDESGEDESGEQTGDEHTGDEPGQQEGATGG